MTDDEYSNSIISLIYLENNNILIDDGYWNRIISFVILYKLDYIGQTLTLWQIIAA